MAKRCIGIDIGSSYLRAVQAANIDGQIVIEKVFVAQTRRSVDSLPQILTELTHSEGFDRKAPVAIAAPQNHVFFRNVQFDKTDLDRILSQDTSPLKRNFPLHPDKIVTELTLVAGYEAQNDHFRITIFTLLNNHTFFNQRLIYLFLDLGHYIP